MMGGWAPNPWVWQDQPVLMMNGRWWSASGARGPGGGHQGHPGHLPWRAPTVVSMTSQKNGCMDMGRGMVTTPHPQAATSQAQAGRISPPREEIYPHLKEWRPSPLRKQRDQVIGSQEATCQGYSDPPPPHSQAGMDSEPGPKFPLWKERSRLQPDSRIPPLSAPCPELFHGREQSGGFGRGPVATAAEGPRSETIRPLVGPEQGRPRYVGDPERRQDNGPRPNRACRMCREALTLYAEVVINGGPTRRTHGSPATLLFNRSYSAILVPKPRGPQLPWMGVIPEEGARTRFPARMSSGTREEGMTPRVVQHEPCQPGFAGSSEWEARLRVQPKWSRYAYQRVMGGVSPPPCPHTRIYRVRNALILVTHLPGGPVVVSLLGEASDPPLGSY